MYHCAVIALLRPFADSVENLQFRSFSSKDSTPSTIFSTSMNQLKRLLFEYLTQSPRLPASGWMNSAVLQISTVIVKNAIKDAHWKFYFHLCF